MTPARPRTPSKHPPAKPKDARADRPSPRGDRPAPRHDPAKYVPPPPLPRDPWAWASVLAVLPLLLHAWGAPLGEPVAEDFDFLHTAMYAPHHSLLDGGGSTAFWRPVAHQLYYQTLGSLILDQPRIVAALHVLLLALSTLLLYLAFRRAWSGPAAALVASFPLFSESTRTLISWPSHFVDLGLWLFVAIAFHEAAARRLGTTLGALLMALLCKEVAIVAAALIPWMPNLGPADRKSRIRWTIAIAVVVAVWALVYLAIRQRAHLVLPHGLESEASLSSGSIPARFAWALGNSLKALFSLPAVHLARTTPIALAALGLVVIGASMLLIDARGRRLLRARLPWIAWGGAWFIGATVTLMTIFPIWAPNRSGFGSLGFGVVVVALLEAARPSLLAALAALRLAAFAMSPGPPAVISMKPADNGAFMDFEQLARLQRLMRQTRDALHARYPRLPAGASIGQLYMPWRAEYAFGGDHALHVWYRDTTLHWVRFEQLNQHPETPLTTVVEFEVHGTPQIALLAPEAVKRAIAATHLQTERRWAESMTELAIAESLETDPAAAAFRGTLASEQAVALMALGRYDEAQKKAELGVTLSPANPDGHYALAFLAMQSRRFDVAQREVDITLSASPRHPGALALRRLLEGAGRGR